jgi:hypothetical protein
MLLFKICIGSAVISVHAKATRKISKTVMSFIIFVLAFAVSESTERNFLLISRSREMKEKNL